ncbi:MAG TPA: alkaline phosphatase D family protein [Anaerolineae bacterium]|nr:alkaline phosphatase D family protein [Anaerolineae bacterium]
MNRSLLLLLSSVVVIAVILIGAAPSLALPGAQNDEDAPAVTHGPLSGEVTDTSVVLWARGSVTGTLTFEVAETEGFDPIVDTATVEIEAATDLTGQVQIEGLDPGGSYVYRVSLEADGDNSEAVSGQFNLAPTADDPAPFEFVFGACLGGQGYCRNPETGWTIFETMLAEEPDFFLLLGDGVYVDSACPAPDNVAGAEGPFTDLAGFRTRYRYHLEDPSYAAFLAQTPVYVTWDDHEIVDNFGGPALQTLNPGLFADGLQAFFEYWPLTGTPADPNQIYRPISYGGHADFFILDTRSYRDPNVNWDPNPRTLAPKTMLGPDQFAWLQTALNESEATWKFIVTSVPLSYPTGFPQPEVDGRDGWANLTEKSGYETELMALLFYIEQAGLENVVFLTADTHWPFALSYDPDRDGEANFHEFGSSPMSAITLPPAENLDPTFNPTVLYAEGEFQGTLFNFGHIAIADDGDVTFRVVDWEGTERYTLTLPAE